jgi:hypothetical protein
MCDGLIPTRSYFPGPRAALALCIVTVGHRYVGSASNQNKFET